MSGSAQVLKDIGGILPLVVLWAGACVVLLLAPFARSGPGSRASGHLALVTVLASLAVLIRRPESGYGTELFGAGLFSDTLSTAAAFVLLISATLAILVAQGYLRSRSLEKPEYYGLLLLSLSGAYLMLLANDLLLLLLALELMSFGFYILAGFDRASARSEEAALKYLITGAFASGLLIYGMMLFFACTGTTGFEAMRSAIAHGALKTPMGIGAVILTLTGLGFKVAAVPFHQWTPDVYEGAPTSVTAFLAATAKIGAFAALIRVADAIAGGSATWLPALRTIAILTMIVGNLLAIAQTNVKRMLGYSAIAHAGYLLTAVVCVGMRFMGPAASRAGIPAMNATVFYLLAYALASLGAFGVLAYLSGQGRDAQTLEHLRGVARRDAFAGYGMVVFMLSLAGIPATAGFVGKWAVFYAVLTAGDVSLALAIALTSALAAYYYLRVAWYVVFEEPSSPAGETTMSQTPSSVAVALAALATLVLGVVPGALMGFLSVVR